jgi:hypothetical protein
MSARSFAPLPLGCCGCLYPPDMLPGTGLGECVVAGDGDGGILIVRADPHIAVSGQLLRDWHDRLPGPFGLECHGDPDHIGDLIRVEAADQRVVYVITRVADRANDVWEASWPD